ncbi:portal protein [Gordonia phage Sapo]|nr:portal protein [Gordonia phage Sapo]
MGLASWLGFGTNRVLPDSAPTEWSGTTSVSSFVRDLVLEQSPEELWAQQPHLRTVVDFLARNVGQLTVYAYERKPEGGAEKLTNHPLAKLLRKPNPEQTNFEFFRALTADKALYDEAFALVLNEARDDGLQHSVRLLRPDWVVGTKGASAYDVKFLLVRFPESPETFEVPADKVLHFHGWNPTDPRTGQTPLLALKETLAEQVAAASFRRQLWARGGRVGSFLSRPAGAPKWDPKVRSAFLTAFRNAWTGNNATSGGGVPLLEDGMTLQRVGFSAKEEQFVEGTKLSLQTVASVYHVNPTMVGLLDNANYSNVREFRRSLYGETLGPRLVEDEQRLNEFLLPLLGYDNDKYYVEYDVQSRLRGSVDEQAKVLQSAVGGPWLTVNEARAQNNLPGVEGGDELIRPKNLYQNGEQGAEVEEEETESEDEENNNPPPGGPAADDEEENQ